MGTNGVVDDLVRGQFGGEVSDVGRGGAAVVELLAEGPLQAFDAPSELWRAWEQEEEFERMRLAVHLELGLELAAAINLQGLDGKGQPVQHLLQALGGGCRHCAHPDLGRPRATGRINQGEVFEDPTGDGTHVQGHPQAGTRLDQITGQHDGIVLGLAHGVGTGGRATTSPP